MPRRQDLEKEERRAARLYEAVLALGVVILAGGLLLALGLVLHTTVLSTRERRDFPPAGISTLPPESPAPLRP